MWRNSRCVPSLKCQVAHERASVPLVNSDQLDKLEFVALQSFAFWTCSNCFFRLPRRLVSEPGGPPVGDPSLTSSTRRAPAFCQAPEVEPRCPRSLGMALLRLDRLGIPRFHRQSRHGDWLAAEGLWPVLELEDSPWQARPPGGAETRSPVDPYAQPRKSTMGRSPHSRRTAQARHHHRRDQRHQVHGPAPPASVTGSKTLGSSKTEV